MNRLKKVLAWRAVPHMQEMDAYIPRLLDSLIRYLRCLFASGNSLFDCAGNLAANSCEIARVFDHPDAGTASNRENSLFFSLLAGN